MRRVPSTVVVLGLASLLSDLSSEMIFALLPAFLAGLGAGPAALGLIEGVAEATAAAFKLLSGFWTDRAGKRKPLVLLGYTIAGTARPLVALAGSWGVVLAIRFADRVGKGLRTSPRDALIADVTPYAVRGAAYGLHRAMDHAGAVLGPLVAAALLHFAGLPERQVMLFAAVPAAVVLLTLLFGVREPARAPAPFGPRPPLRLRLLPRNYRRLLLALFVATLGNSTDAFVLLRLQQLGVPLGAVALLWSLHHVVRVPATWWGGRLVDRLGPRAMLLFAWGVYAAVYAGLAFAEGRAEAVAIFLAYGFYYGFSEPAERAWVAALAPREGRGAAFGLYHAVTGLALLPASVLCGLLWSRFGPAAGFLAGAALSAAASLLLLRVSAPGASEPPAAAQ
jgi:MFS family permease